MHQERVTAVSGGNVLAGGRWLRAIGNQTIEAGDLIWTDGRCVYGNLAEGGETAPVAVSRELHRFSSSFSSGLRGLKASPSNSNRITSRPNRLPIKAVMV